MGRLLIPMLALSLMAAGGQHAPPVPLVRLWINAVLAHRPGVVDPPLREMAATPPATFQAVANDLEKALRRDFRDPETRNDVRRRGALLHTDIALLLPQEAASFKQRDAVSPPRSAELDRMGQAIAKPANASLVYLVDGQYVASGEESGHWPFASRLLAGVTDAASDEFVRLWYRAVAATFLSEYRLGNATFHMQRAREVLPRDPVLLLYSGALAETLASGRVRAAEAARPPNVEIFMGQFRNSPDSGGGSDKDRLQTAERYLREAVRAGGPIEASVRLGRVTGRLGKHVEAVQLLGPVAPPRDSRVAYLLALFLGTEYGAIAKTDEARASLERAAALYPNAQSPLIALVDLFRRAANRSAAVESLGRLEALPVDVGKRADPWWDYYRSYAGDAEKQMAGVRAWVMSRGTR